MGSNWKGAKPTLPVEQVSVILYVAARISHSLTGEDEFDAAGKAVGKLPLTTKDPAAVPELTIEAVPEVIKFTALADIVQLDPTVALEFAPVALM